MTDGQLAVFSRGSRWVLLDEAAAELGCFETQTEALAKAGQHVGRLEEPRYVLIQGADGEWREDLLRPAHADRARRAP